MLVHFVLLLLFLVRTVQPATNLNQRTTEYWKKMGEFELEAAKHNFKNLKTGRAKNVIMLIGDGMSLATSTAGRIAIGQKNNMKGEEYVTSLDMMPHSGTVKTYSLNYQTPDSAATATAFLTGVKTRSGMLGVNGRVKKCGDIRENTVNSTMEYAIKEGKSAGIVTTTRVQHATPAATYAHTYKRGMYSDNLKASDDRRCIDIALQLFNRRRDIQVILGGGRAHMTPKSVTDEENSNLRGERTDTRNLIKEWEEEFKNSGGKYVWKKDQFERVDPNTINYLLGLFNPKEMQYALNKQFDRGGEPSLAEMTEKAIQILQKNEKGFFLLVESGMLDKAHHEGRAKLAIEEFHELEKALSVAQSLTSPEDTLIITTADHGHMFMLGGGAIRGNDVFGLAPSHEKPSQALDGKLYTSIVYGNGPGHAASDRNKEAPRQSVQSWRVGSKYYRQQAVVPLLGETHSAEDVVVYGSGPMAHLLTGVHEQTHIANVVMYAACLGPDYKGGAHCGEDGIPSATLVEENKNQKSSRAKDSSSLIDGTGEYEKNFEEEAN